MTLLRCIKLTSFFNIYLEDISSFCGATDTPVWTSGDICPGFQRQGGFLTCVLRLIPSMDPSDSPVV